MAAKRQKRKWFLTLRRLIVTVDRTKLSFRIEGFQGVESFPFLILKTPFAREPTTERAPRYASDGGGTAVLLRIDNDLR